MRQLPHSPPKRRVAIAAALLLAGLAPLGTDSAFAQAAFHATHPSTDGLPPPFFPTLPFPTASSAAPSPWLATLEPSDIPSRWDGRISTFLESYRRGTASRAFLRTGLIRSGRYSAMMREVLRAHQVPEDLIWLSYAESTFQATVRSPAGAVGLWQFTVDTARDYGLRIDRWTDERLDPIRSTRAAAQYLRDLNTRYGNWELAFAAYNMGIGGLNASIRKYNTNDYWALTRLEAALPLETAEYAPKILALATAARNPKAFGFSDLPIESPMEDVRVAVAAGTSLQRIASLLGTTQESLERLNPHLLSGRIPPPPPSDTPVRENFAYEITFPGAFSGDFVRQRLSGLSIATRSAALRVGESLASFARREHIGLARLAEWNHLKPGEGVPALTALIVEDREPQQLPIGVTRPTARNAPADAVPPERAAALGAITDRPVVTVPRHEFQYPNAVQRYLRVEAGDTMEDLANTMGLSQAHLCLWNPIIDGSKLQAGMMLRVYLSNTSALLTNTTPLPQSPERSLAHPEDLHALPVLSPGFFRHYEALKGRQRVLYTAKEGDTWEGLSRRFGLSLGNLERLNHRWRSSTLEAGDPLVVYVTPR